MPVVLRALGCCGAACSRLLCCCVLSAAVVLRALGCAAVSALDIAQWTDMLPHYAVRRTLTQVYPAVAPDTATYFVIESRRNGQVLTASGTGLSLKPRVGADG